MKRVPLTHSDEEKKKPKESASADAKSTTATSRIQEQEPTEVAPAVQTEPDDPMAGLQADLDRFRDLALRSQADFENYKKRSAREKEEAIKYANSSLLERLVGVIDNFELGLTAAKDQAAGSPI